jgi:hypothetical protein
VNIKEVINQATVNIVYEHIGAQYWSVWDTKTWYF